MIRIRQTWAKCKGGSVTRFLAFFFSRIEPTWAPDKQAKMVLLQDSFSRKYSRIRWLRADKDCADSNFSNYQFKYIRKNDFLNKHCLPIYQGPRWVRFMITKIATKFRDTATLKPSNAWSTFLSPIFVIFGYVICSRKLNTLYFAENF